MGTLARTTMASITQSAVLGNVRAFKAAKTTKRSTKPVAARAGLNEFAEKVSKGALSLGVAGAVLAQSAGAVTYDELQGLTYLQVKGTGLANTCPVVEGGVSGKEIKAGDYALERFCMEPTSFTVKEESQFKQGESEFSKTRLMTRLTYTLRHDWLLQGWLRWLRQRPRERWPRLPPVTVQLPGGERVPFLFTLKEFTGKGNTSQFGGDFVVPSYRGSSFLDPKGRGGSTGYDNAVALPARADSEELQKENQKNTAALNGSAVFNVAKYDPATGEIAGVFESIQPSDTDLGAKVPKDVKITGLWYANIAK